MQSKRAKEARKALIAANQSLAPEQRLEAFLVHCRLMAELREIGRNLPRTRTVSQP
jgi:hypothetical protein